MEAPHALVLPPRSTSYCSKFSFWFQCFFCVRLIKAIALQNIIRPKELLSLMLYFFARIYREPLDIIEYLVCHAI